MVVTQNSLGTERQFVSLFDVGNNVCAKTKQMTFYIPL